MPGRRWLDREDGRVQPARISTGRREGRFHGLDVGYGGLKDFVLLGRSLELPDKGMFVICIAFPPGKGDGYLDE